MSGLARHSSKRAMRGLVRRAGGARTVASSAGTGATSGESAASEVTEVAAVNTLPKFVMGHPVLGAIPADPVTNPTWEI